MNESKRLEIKKELQNEKIFEIEILFNDCFNNAIEKIKYYPHTLRGVIGLGFNYLFVQTKDGKYQSGWDESDFDEELLNSVVRFDYWDTDDDGCRVVKLIQDKEDK